MRGGIEQGRVGCVQPVGQGVGIKMDGIKQCTVRPAAGKQRFTQCAVAVGKSSGTAVECIQRIRIGVHERMPVQAAQYGKGVYVQGKGGKFHGSYLRSMVFYPVTA